MAHFYTDIQKKGNVNYSAEASQSAVRMTEIMLLGRFSMKLKRNHEMCVYALPERTEVW